MPRAIHEFRYWLLRYRRVWRATILSSVLTPAVYLGSVGSGLGSMVGRHASASLGGVTYLVFLAPGLLAAQAMLTAQAEATFPVYAAVTWTRSYRAAAASPLSPADIFFGHLMFIIFRITMNSAVFLVVMAVFGTLRSPLALASLPAAVLTGAAMAVPLQALAVTCTSDTPLNLIQRFGIVPVFLFSGTFYPVTRLPAWARDIAYATPLWHGVALCRSITLDPPGGVPLDASLGHIAYLVVFTAAGMIIALRAYAPRLQNLRQAIGP